MNLNNATNLIRQWAKSKGIDKLSPRDQALKIGEEVGELNRGILRQNNSLIEDSIGDIFIALNNLAMQYGLTLEECVFKAYNEIKDRNGENVNGVFIKEDDLETDEDIVFNSEPTWTSVKPTKTLPITISDKKSYTKEQHELACRTAKNMGIQLTEYDTVYYKGVYDDVIIWTDSSMYGKTDCFRLNREVCEALINELNKDEDIDVLDIDVLEHRFEKREHFKFRVTDGYFLVLKESSFFKDKDLVVTAIPLEVIQHIFSELNI